MTKKTRKAVIMIVLLCTVITVTLTYAIYKTITYELYKERCYHLKETTGQMISQIDYVISNQWKQLSIADASMHKYFENHKNTENPSEIVDYNNEMLRPEAAEIVVFDDKGNVYYKNGVQRRWTEPDILVRGEKTQLLIHSEKTYTVDRNVCVLFLKKLDTPILLGKSHKKLTHIAILQKMEYFESIFKSSAYQKANNTVLITSNGNRIYYDNYPDNISNEEGKIINSYNVIEAMANCEFLYDSSYDTFKNDITSGESGVAEIVIDNTDYFIAYGSIDNGRRLMILVSGEYVSANSSGFTSVLLQTIVFFGSLFLLLVTVVVFVITYSSGQSKIYKKEREMNERLQKAIEETNRANRAKTDFLTHISHDIRTPINGIMGMLDIADRHIGDLEKVEDCLNKIRSSSNHLLLLINDILDMSQIENERLELAEECFEITSLLDACITIIMGQIEEKNLLFIPRYGGIKHKNLVGSPLHLRQILLNILSNAVKYTDNGGRIEFSVDEIDSYSNCAIFKFVIKDNGIGMSEDFQRKIFEPFTRGNNSYASQFKGSGLGMSICKALTTKMGGKIKVESKLNVGSTFTIVIPFQIDSSPSLAEKQSDSDTSDNIKGMRILVAEDNELNSEIAKELLEDAGAVVTLAKDGREAVSIFKQSHICEFDLILMDIMMPTLNGYEATQIIRSLSRTDAQTVPIVAMTANAFSHDIQKAKQVGMNDHIAKPIDVKKMYEVISRYNKGCQTIT